MKKGEEIERINATCKLVKGRKKGDKKENWLYKTEKQIKDKEAAFICVFHCRIFTVHWLVVVTCPLEAGKHYCRSSMEKERKRRTTLRIAESSHCCDVSPSGFFCGFLLFIPYSNTPRQQM